MMAGDWGGQKTWFEAELVIVSGERFEHGLLPTGTGGGLLGVSIRETPLFCPATTSS